MPQSQKITLVRGQIMKLRLWLLLAVILLLVVGTKYWVQPTVESLEPDAIMANCGKIRQCIQATEAWSSELQFCASALPPLTVRRRAANGKWGYFVSYGECSNEQITASRFDIAEKFDNNGLAKVQINGKWGYINLKGEEKIEPVFDEAGDFDNGLVPVKAKGKWGYFNTNGQVVIPLGFDAVTGTWSDGLTAVQIGPRWGYINARGETVIEPKFDKAMEFNSNFATVMVQKKWGAINALGDVIIPLNFDVIFSTANADIYLVSLNQKFGYFNKKGTEIIPPRLVKPVKVRLDAKGAIQIQLNESTLSAADDNAGEGKVGLDDWFDLDAENEKVRFDDNGKALLWRNNEWFSVTKNSKLVKFRGKLPQ
jgi:hypothetical protein